MAMGTAYLEDALRAQELEHAEEVDERRRAAKALGLAHSRLQLGRQHHQQHDKVEDLEEAVHHYRLALELAEGSRDFLAKEAEQRMGEGNEGNEAKEGKGVRNA